MDVARLKIMDSQRFDPTRRSNRPNLTIRTGGNDDDEVASMASHIAEPATPISWITYEEPTLAASDSDSFSDSLEEEEETCSPPTSLKSSITLDEDSLDPKSIHQTDVFDKGTTIMTRTIIRPIPRSPLLSNGCLSRPSSPLGIFSRPSSPLKGLNLTSRPSSPINFGALNCFSSDAFAEEADYLQEKRALELEGRGALEVHVDRQVTTEVEMPWIVQKVVDPEGLRRRMMERRTTISSP
ncbi:hypothetical protein FB45DRAFT_210253 [Roridomyces roridus]|uniref:Uncharacterized protein n=1 Tax=Roridomyces roridus TaxID=1738132 RepID=A0AAD7CGJ1_9AGAR|nr:hypothetical protein FB45DRAFT_210253 [Roridomyces roridus]